MSDLRHTSKESIFVGDGFVPISGIHIGREDNLLRFEETGSSTGVDNQGISVAYPKEEVIGTLNRLDSIELNAEFDGNTYIQE